MSIGSKSQTDQSLSEQANAVFLKASEDVVEKAKQARGVLPKN